jgi:putative SOS response-associated peptidase YedK
MCNLYSMTATHQAMRQLFRVQSGINQLHLPGILPDYQAPIVRQRADGERQIVMARWRMSTPQTFRRGPIDRGVTNIRNTSSPHWHRWLQPEFRCLVPATSFCEPSDLPGPDGKKGPRAGSRLCERSFPIDFISRSLKFSENVFHLPPAAARKAWPQINHSVS